MAGQSTYDYPAIDECNRQIAAAVDKMQNTSTEMRKDVQKLIEEVWGGDSATSYEQTSTEINKDLERRQEKLFNVGASLKSGAGDMQQTDQDGKKRMQV